MNETISPEECIDTFLYDVLQAEDYRIKWDKKDVFGKPSDVGLQPLCTPTDETIEEWRSEGILPTLGDVLSDEDKTLLEEYIPKLFNTINEPEKNLADAIYTLTVLVRSYRDAERERTILENIRLAHSITLCEVVREKKKIPESSEKTYLILCL